MSREDSSFQYLSLSDTVHRTSACSIDDSSAVQLPFRVPGIYRIPLYIARRSFNPQHCAAIIRRASRNARFWNNASPTIRDPKITAGTESPFPVYVGNTKGHASTHMHTNSSTDNQFAVPASQASLCPVCESHAMRLSSTVSFVVVGSVALATRDEGDLLFNPWAVTRASVTCRERLTSGEPAALATNPKRSKPLHPHNYPRKWRGPQRPR